MTKADLVQMQPQVFDSHCGTRAKGRTIQLENLLQELESFCYYNPESGDFIATRVRQGSPVYPGTKIINLDIEGYNRVHVRGKTYKAHNLAWLWMTGAWPENQIDHIDRIKDNNAWLNLRDVTVSQNHYNKNLQKNNTSGIAGVVWHAIQGKWMATIQVNKRKIHLGYFTDFESAVAARKHAESIYVL